MARLKGIRYGIRKEPKDGAQFNDCNIEYYTQIKFYN